MSSKRSTESVSQIKVTTSLPSRSQSMNISLFTSSDLYCFSVVQANSRRRYFTVRESTLREDQEERLKSEMSSIIRSTILTGLREEARKPTSLTCDSSILEWIRERSFYFSEKPKVNLNFLRRKSEISRALSLPAKWENKAECSILRSLLSGFTSIEKHSVNSRTKSQAS